MNDLLSATTNNIAGTSALITTAVLGLLALKYNDRAIFTDRRNDIPNLPKSVPLFGILFDQIANKERNLDWFNENITKLDSMTMYV